MEMDVSKYRDLFVSEAREHLQDMNQLLLRLEKEPGNIDVLRDIFRSAHTLKGMSATMGYDKLTQLTHEMENLLDQLRSGNVQVAGETVDLLFSCFDAGESIINDIDAEKPEEADISELLKELRTLAEGYLEQEVPPLEVGERGGEREGEGMAREAEKAPEKRLEITPEEVARHRSQPGVRIMRLVVEVDEDCLLKSVRVFMVFKKLAQLGEVISSLPSIEALEDEHFETSFQLGFATKKDPKEVTNALASIAEVREVSVEEVCGPWEELPGGPPAAKGPPAKGSEAAPPIPGRAQSVRINIERLDSLMNLVGELVINRTRLEEIAADYDIADLNEALDQVSRLTTELQDEVMKTRMVPVENIFNRFPRMVRDLARSQGKEIDLIIQGREIELDRTILDEISDPLVHMLRNAVDHGITTPEDREAKGKPRRGRVRLSASRDRNFVSIEVDDDGEGIDGDAVYRRGVELGMIPEGESTPLGDDDILRIISTPGYSSSGIVTGVSGRGVGMDVVKMTTERLGGFVLLETRTGEGTRVILKLPLTLAIVQALMVGVGDETYAMSLGTVRETQEIPPEEIKSVKGQEVVVLRGETVPLLMLDRVLGVEETWGRTEPLPVVITEMGSKLLAVGVHRLLGKQEIVINTLDRYLRRVEGFAGTTILGSGRVALILDIPGMLTSAREQKVKEG